MAGTPGHTFKLDEEPWQRFLDKARSRGRSASEIIVAAIMMYSDDEIPENADELDRAADVYGTSLGVGGRPRKDQIQATG